ncbi:MAG: winged helix-turn-helix domain-containing protein [Desulfobulbus sp.]
MSSVCIPQHESNTASRTFTRTISAPPPAKESNKSILFLTEDEQANKALLASLDKEDFSIRLSHKKNNYLAEMPPRETQLIILDSGRFSLDELSSLPKIRSIYTGLLMLLIDDIDEMLQVLLYEQGVDDLLVKPVNHLLIAARIRALFRRNQQRSAPATLLFNGLEINQGLRRATYLGEEIPFTSREFDLLWYLAKNACTTLDRDHLYRAVFGIEYNGYDRSIDMYIARIRCKIAPYPNLAAMIKTVRGTGYLFAAEQ